MSSETADTKKRRSPAQSLLELVLIVVVALGLALAIQAFIVKPYKIPSQSMEPTLDVGQRVLVNRVGARFGSFGRGDIVVFHPPRGAEERYQCGVVAEPQQPCPEATHAKADTTFIKRVIGVGGDHIAIKSCKVYLDGELQVEPYIKPGESEPQCNFPSEITVPADHFFMMGDNRAESDDSRFWGPIPKSWIIGSAFATYWPPSRVGLL